MRFFSVVLHLAPTYANQNGHTYRDERTESSCVGGGGGGGGGGVALAAASAKLGDSLAGDASNFKGGVGVGTSPRPGGDGNSRYKGKVTRREPSYLGVFRRERGYTVSACIIFLTVREKIFFSLIPSRKNLYPAPASTVVPTSDVCTVYASTEAINFGFEISSARQADTPTPLRSLKKQRLYYFCEIIQYAWTNTVTSRGNNVLLK